MNLVLRSSGKYEVTAQNTETLSNTKMFNVNQSTKSTINLSGFEGVCSESIRVFSSDFNLVINKQSVLRAIKNGGAVDIKGRNEYVKLNQRNNGIKKGLLEMRNVDMMLFVDNKNQECDFFFGSYEFILARQADHMKRIQLDIINKLAQKISDFDEDKIGDILWSRMDSLKSALSGTISYGSVNIFNEIELIMCYHELMGLRLKIRRMGMNRNKMVKVSEVTEMSKKAVKFSKRASSLLNYKII